MEANGAGPHVICGFGTKEAQGVDLVEREVVDTESGRPIPPGTVGIICHGHMLREVDTLQREGLLMIEDPADGGRGISLTVTR